MRIEARDLRCIECPTMPATGLRRDQDRLICDLCGAEYPVILELPVMLSPSDQQSSIDRAAELSDAPPPIRTGSFDDRPLGFQDLRGLTRQGF